jgi:hypothetical protein
MTKDTIKLIDGNFSPSSAQSILIELINHKINFHGSEKNCALAKKMKTQKAGLTN